MATGKPIRILAANKETYRVMARCVKIATDDGVLKAGYRPCDLFFRLSIPRLLDMDN